MGRTRARRGWIAWAGIAGLIVACVEPAHEYQGSFIDPPLPLPDIHGTNWDGSPFSLKGVDGTLVIVFFGYTHCPDVCPMTLSRLKSLHSRLGDRARDVAVVLISVDPDRDSLSQLGEYVQGFDEDFYGVHLSREALAVMAAKWGIVVQRGEPEEDADGWYGVDHTGALYVLGPQRGLQLRFPQELGVDEMLLDVQALLDMAGAPPG
jgi:protein SCO1/2